MGPVGLVLCLMSIERPLLLPSLLQVNNPRGYLSKDYQTRFARKMYNPLALISQVSIITEFCYNWKEALFCLPVHNH